MHARRWLRVVLAVLDSEIKARCISCRTPSGNGKEVRRRVWRVVGVGVGLLRHDGEVEGVVNKFRQSNNCANSAVCTIG